MVFSLLCLSSDNFYNCVILHKALQSSQTCSSSLFLKISYYLIGVTASSARVAIGLHLSKSCL